VIVFLIETSNFIRWVDHSPCTIILTSKPHDPKERANDRSRHHSGIAGRFARNANRPDNQQMTARMREVHGLCGEHRDVASRSLLENWIDEAERRTWFLFEATRGVVID
jgi:hypothetical protein